MTNPTKKNSSSSDCSRIITLNNEGATSLASGDMSLAISTFCQALHKSKSCLGRRNERRRNHDNRSCYRYIHRRDDNFYENYDDRDHQLGISEEHDLQPLSPPLPHLDIGHLMEADCFGLNTREECNGQYDDVDTDSNSIKISFPVSSSYSNLRQNKKCDSNRGIDDIDFKSGDFIYRKPIHVPKSYAHHAGLQQSEVNLPSIVIFNLALAHHLWSMKQERSRKHLTVSCSGDEQSSSSMLLKKAAKLYGLAIQLQEGQMVSEGPHSYSKLFFLSCINNLGNTHRLLGDTTSSEKIYQQLLAMLMYLNYSEQQHGYELSTAASITNNSSSSTDRISTSTFPAARTYGSFFRNIFQREVKAAPAA